MQSNLKKIIVYDIESGGLSSTYNAITEIAMVAIDLETLKKIDECSVMLKPRINLKTIEPDPITEAKNLYKRLGEKDEEGGIKVLSYGGEKITLKNIQPLVDGCAAFAKLIDEEYRGGVLLLDDINNILKTDLSAIMQIYIDSTYSPQALEVTKIPFSMLVEEGVEYEEAFKTISTFINTHTTGNNKPIISGHNIKDFDNAFMEIFFKDNKSDFYKGLNNLMLDTLEMARLKFWELPSYSLGVVANELGLTLKGAHRALEDTRANADVLIEMLKSLRGDGGSNTKYVRRKFKMNF